MCVSYIFFHEEQLLVEPPCEVVILHDLDPVMFDPTADLVEV